MNQLKEMSQLKDLKVIIIEDLVKRVKIPGEIAIRNSQIKIARTVVQNLI